MLSNKNDHALSNVEVILNSRLIWGHIAIIMIQLVEHLFIETYLTSFQMVFYKESKLSIIYLFFALDITPTNVNYLCMENSWMTLLLLTMISGNIYKSLNKILNNDLHMNSMFVINLYFDSSKDSSLVKSSFDTSNHIVS